ncbi:hypothetical protein GCM10009504_42090 [Pseudomonas laurentiana]|nr:hypothetical protein GCM10009504_42090 [Pseudomonas laurentiana]
MTNLGVEEVARPNGAATLAGVWAPLIKKCAILASVIPLDQQKYDERCAMLRGVVPALMLAAAGQRSRIV